jgi:hypothetical protein
MKSDSLQEEDAMDMNTMYDIILKKKPYIEQQNTTFKKNFLLCKSCFWCASLLNDRSIEVCPSCMNCDLDSMPISFNKTSDFL